ncbi:MAG TPA: universal stress protein [Luteibacter sp.]|uniref:universal stress protein n=1 Tax=Luteibacter sp. TaxID=1886636 RepID=UPI002CCE0021|nr:universal stress protein [Luteibacter sp.]HVI55969.1 universal stress protein [Luteibacter sp.]
MDTTTTPPTRTAPSMRTCLSAIGDVLAIVDSPRSSAAYVASRLAARDGGSVTGCSLAPAFMGGRPFRVEASVISLLETPPPIQRHDDLRRGHDGDEFLRLATTAGVLQPQWAVIGNDPSHDLAKLSAWHDLIVVQRPGDPHADPLDGLQHLLTNTGLPCLVLPTQCAPTGVFDSVVLAWDGSRPATRAMRAALPLIVAAHDVVVLDGRPSHGAAEEPAFDPMSFLARHGVRATLRHLHTTPTDAGAAILKKAHQLKADLLVMGAFGHSPLRERLFGGATRHILTHGDLVTWLYR